MSRPVPRRSRNFWLVSLLLHGGAALIPLSWLTVDSPAGGGGGGGGPVAVSLVAFASLSDPAAAVPTVPAPPPSPDAVEVDALPPEPEPVRDPAPVASDPKPTEAGEAPGAAVVGEGGPAPDPGEGLKGVGPGPTDGDGAGAGAGDGSRAAYRPPRLLAGALPLTPEESKDLDLPREIPVRLKIGTDGSVVEIEPADPALPEVLKEALRRSAAAMRFVPAKLGEEPVEAWFSMTFIYRR